MRYAGIIENDVVNGEGVCLSVFTQGCPHRCKGCFNSETWDFDGGIEVEDMDKFIKDIVIKIRANGVHRNLSILGGEPLCKENQHFVSLLVGVAKEAYPDIKIFLWTGYYLEDVPKNVYTEPKEAQTFDDGYDLGYEDAIDHARKVVGQRKYDKYQEKYDKKMIMYLFYFQVMHQVEKNSSYSLQDEEFRHEKVVRSIFCKIGLSILKMEQR